MVAQERDLKGFDIISGPSVKPWRNEEAFDAFIAIPGTSKSWVRTTPGAVAHSGEKREERIFRQSHGNVGLENTKTRLPVCESKSSAI